MQSSLNFSARRSLVLSGKSALIFLFEHRIQRVENDEQVSVYEAVEQTLYNALSSERQDIQEG